MRTLCALAVVTTAAGVITGLPFSTALACDNDRFPCPIVSDAPETTEAPAKAAPGAPRKKATNQAAPRQDERATLQDEKALSRRDFFASGAAAGVGAAVLSAPGEAQAQGIQWNYEVDVVVLGSGCVGLHAAVRARDLGASVLVIDQNFDVGGKLVHSGGWTSLGGGDAGAR